MKTFGILLLFGLCTATGMRIASQKTERFRSVGALMQQIQTFSDAVCEETSLQRIAERNAGELFVMLKSYLNARSNAQDESEAASFAVQEWKLFDAEYTALLTFLQGCHRLLRNGCANAYSRSNAHFRKRSRKRRRPQSRQRACVRSVYWRASDCAFYCCR